MYEIKLLRVLNDLKYGIPVALKHNEKSLHLVAVDRISKDQYSEIKKNWLHAKLVISGPRSKFLTKNIICENSQISCQDLNWQEVQEIIYANSISSTKLEKINNISREAFKLLALAEIFPAFIIGTPKTIPDFTLSFNIDTLSENIGKINNNLYEICRADLQLKKAVGKIIAFRCHWQKDHYAVLIHPINQQTLPPLVRLHSSCFTGDLLASLKCDCYDQLQGAIEIMSANNGGVILYINQEGRGIGLTNKIRVYNMIANGYDTVDANENLGFDNDLRDFSIAANILKKININEIKLLSNNPNKGKVLQQHGIKIQDYVSHQFLHEEIEKYYQAKAQKMNHKIDI
tara:strand:- start:711 stop:1745 length:1035 start_codon:yes stop_codon:yes gene_type:complete